MFQLRAYFSKGKNENKNEIGISVPIYYVLLTIGFKYSNSSTCPSVLKVV